ncbi:HAD family hydrolase [bacterium]|nr:HAD family hydrolase [candidate division CSSED10-310 bacterium]
MPFYKAVCFDLFDTLVFFDKTTYYTVREQGLLETSIDPAMFNQAWKSTRDDAFNGTIRTLAERYRKVMEIIGCDADAYLEYLCKLEVQAATLATRPVEGIQDLLSDLKRSKKRLGLITNASCIAPLILSILGWQTHFDETVFSYLEKVRKPDPEIFFLASRRLVCRTDCMAYVSDGDRFELTGASDAGLDPIRFDPSGEYKNHPLPPGCFDCKDINSLRERLLT